MSTVLGPLTSAVQSAWMLMEVPESERKVPLPRLVPVGITDAALPASEFPEAAVWAPGTIGMRSWAGSMLASAPGTGVGVAAAVPAFPAARRPEAVREDVAPLRTRVLLTGSLAPEWVPGLLLNVQGKWGGVLSAGSNFQFRKGQYEALSSGLRTDGDGFIWPDGDTPKRIYEEGGYRIAEVRKAGRAVLNERVTTNTGLPGTGKSKTYF